ncbi:CGNR zinc finger domain-containing protein [Umezawaea endophytica]|uniref:CGNR zinc finger domain-containing protein n=1 Tax=Umezawaea endophytica TaxID=1654476 RepID=A0A9X3AIC5_9PSEU|nr:ABATE domain-containing protein [Umezawaea endophytica]MCS7482927.1 CGNR zinc finger domain-containing protein [Umezawaea endophytica]
MTPGTRLLVSAEGDRYRFDPGSLSLELLLTGGPGPYERYEIAHIPADLAEWFTGSRLALTAPLAIGDIQLRPAEFTALKELRNALYRVAPAVAHGEPPSDDDLTLLNNATAATPRPRIDPETRQLVWAPPVTGKQLLGAVARDAIELIAGGRSGRVRECSASDCHLLFLDTSRSGNRRWCSMERCGNRAKIRAYRARTETA